MLPVICLQSPASQFGVSAILLLTMRPKEKALMGACSDNSRPLAHKLCVMISYTQPWLYYESQDLAENLTYASPLPINCQLQVTISALKSWIWDTFFIQVSISKFDCVPSIDLIESLLDMEWNTDLEMHFQSWNLIIGYLHSFFVKKNMASQWWSWAPLSAG
jgi:hypothetical protein